MITQTKIFGLDAEDIGDIAREAFHDCNDVDGPHWPTVGARILCEFLHAKHRERAPDDDAESRKTEHAKVMLAHLSGQP